jgi:hypothetical protein
MGCLPACGVGKVLATDHRNKRKTSYEMLQRGLDLADNFEHGNEISLSIKGGGFLD